MKMTKRFKEKLEEAKKLGYKRVYVTVGKFKATTYCVFHSIDSLLALKEGFDFGWQRPSNHLGMWTRHSNTRMINQGKDIGYHECFKD